MTDRKKKRMSILDSLASAGAPAPPASMMTSNRALRSARDAVDSHHIWELDPDLIDDHRIADRLEPEDVIDLRDAIEQNGQVVPILVRRHPQHEDRYLLVYGRRRLEAIRHSDKVTKIRALVASLDDDSAVRSQISENMARRDLSFIEKALFAKQLVEDGFGNQSQVAEVLTVTKSSVSMALAIVEAVGADLARAIGPAHGIGRPRWEALAKSIEDTGADRERLCEVADDVHTAAKVAAVSGEMRPADYDVSVAAFDAVVKTIGKPPAPKPKAKKQPAGRAITLAGQPAGTVRRTAKGVAIDLGEGAFADWIEAEAQDWITELHARWSKRTED